MPELPEVQTIVDDLRRKVVHRKIIDLWTDWPKSIKGITPAILKKRIRDSKILDVKRLGKNILITLDRDRALLIHQKMTGHLMVGRWFLKKTRAGWLVTNPIRGPFKDRVNQYVHVIFSLDNGKMLALSDMRKFARVDFGESKYIFSLPAIRKLGLDALDGHLTPAIFEKIIRTRRKSIKQTLMDPTVVAGIGNIYADDILWSIKVHPARPAYTLDRSEIKKLLISARKILKKAIRLRGTSVGDYRDTSGRPGGYGRELLVYRRTGEPCRRCRTPIQRMVLGQRPAHFCPRCQKL
ncbi:MAG: bifunctional DNA-formamidopyrimidine glycosylase/DNA-(apurinic or apyrimidinic site) lyase [Candidatus Colwellbacteria bacterium]|nr:bifunctional DNA-formamidopyrimidine glycosylase/DNA-(apurinic or apyrimidinic site) lyase [Candidatus Colwellbacteria bacterium]